MEKDNAVKPSPWCQEEIWKTVYGITAELDYVDNPWFPSIVKFAVSRNSVVVENADSRGEIELQKGLITVKTRPCILVVDKYNLALYECTSEKHETGRWIYFSKNIVPFLSKEYYEAEEIYEKLRHIFKVLAGHVTDKLGF